MTNCFNQKEVPYDKVVSAIEEDTKGKTAWESGITVDIDADYRIWLDYGIRRTYSGAVVSSQSLYIKNDLVFDKLSGQPAYGILYDRNTLIDTFKKP